MLKLNKIRLLANEFGIDLYTCKGVLENVDYDMEKARSLLSGKHLKEKPMIEKSSWQEFSDNGFLWMVNSILHLFGYAIVIEKNKEGIIVDAYPAHCKFRGFDEKSTTKGYKRLTEYMNNNASILLHDFDDDIKEESDKTADLENKKEIMYIIDKINTLDITIVELTNILSFKDTFDVNYVETFIQKIKIADELIHSIENIKDISKKIINDKINMHFNRLCADMIIYKSKLEANERFIVNILRNIYNANLDEVKEFIKELINTDPEFKLTGGYAWELIESIGSKRGIEILESLTGCNAYENFSKNKKLQNLFNDDRLHTYIFEESSRINKLKGEFNNEK